MSRLAKKNSLAEPGYVTLELPLFIPAKTRARILVNLSHSYIGQSRPPSDDANALPKFLNKDMQDLYGFALFDERNRYEIQFQKGW